MRGAFNEVAEQHGFKKFTPAEQERLRDLTGLPLLKALNLPLWKLPRVVSGMRSLMAQHIHQFSPFDGIGRMLQRLSHDGALLAVVSSNSRENVEHILGGYSSLIDHYACGASMFGKAGKLSKVARGAKVAPQDALYIGDEIRDGEAARKAGMAFGAVAWGQNSEPALRALGPTEFFATVEEIAETLCRDSAETAPRRESN